jgi:hypothetical protein
MMAGKYDKLKSSLKPLERPKTPYQERVEKEKAEFTELHGLDPAKIAAVFVLWRDRADALEEGNEAEDGRIPLSLLDRLWPEWAKEGIHSQKFVNLKLEALKQLLDEAYTEQNLSEQRLQSGDSVAVQKEPHAVVKDADAYREWCFTKGYKEAMSLPWQTTNGMVKERLLEGIELPPGVEAYMLTKVVLRKARGSK